MNTDRTTEQGEVGPATRGRRPVALAGLVGVLALVTSACTPSGVADLLTFLALISRLFAFLGGGA